MHSSDPNFAGIPLTEQTTRRREQPLCQPLITLNLKELCRAEFLESLKVGDFHTPSAKRLNADIGTILINGPRKSYDTASIEGERLGERNCVGVIRLFSDYIRGPGERFLPLPRNFTP